MDARYYGADRGMVRVLSTSVVPIVITTNPHIKTTPSVSAAPGRWGKVKVQLTAEVAKDAEII